MAREPQPEPARRDRRARVRRPFDPRRRPHPGLQPGHRPGASRASAEAPAPSLGGGPVTDIHDRFRSLDDLHVPDVFARARALGPKEPQEPPPSAARRIGVILLATLVAAAGFGLLLRARGSQERAPPATTSTTATASVASDGLLALAVGQRI